MPNNTLISRLALDLYDCFVTKERYPAGNPKEYSTRKVPKQPHLGRPNTRPVTTSRQSDEGLDLVEGSCVVDQPRLSYEALRDVEEEVEAKLDGTLTENKAQSGDSDSDTTSNGSEVDIAEFRFFEVDSDNESASTTPNTLSDDSCGTYQDKAVSNNLDSVSDKLRERRVPRIAINDIILILPKISINDEAPIPSFEDEHEYLWVPSRDRHARRRWLHRIGSSASD